MAAVALFEVDVQVVMSANKESVMSEKAMRAGFGQTIVVGYSEPVHSSQFPTFDDFASKVQREWDHQWQRVYSSQPEGKSHHAIYAFLEYMRAADQVLPCLVSLQPYPKLPNMRQQQKQSQSLAGATCCAKCFIKLPTWFWSPGHYLWREKKNKCL